MSHQHEQPGPAPSITTLITSYPILQTLASWISERDLRRLGRTSRTHHAHILASRPIFEVLTRQSTCSGLGLIQRQKQDDFLNNWRGRGHTEVNPGFQPDAEIEVRLYNITCDDGGALPCVGCGVNICEECRYYRRAAPSRVYYDRRPHLKADYSTGDVMTFCERCDEGVEAEVRAKNYLSELCDCDSYTRWRCKPCYHADRRAAREYEEKHTKIEFDWGDWDDEANPTKIAQDHQFERAVGARDPKPT